MVSSPSRARTYNNSVNSRVLYHWAIEDYFYISLGCDTFKTEHKNFFLSVKHFFLPLPSRISPRPISDIQLHTLLYFHPCPIYLVVFKGSYSLLWGISHLEGGFTLRCLQRLSLPDLATLPWIWYPTDTPAVRPSRSSRTKDSSSQISYAHAG